VVWLLDGGFNFGFFSVDVEEILGFKVVEKLVENLGFVGPIGLSFLIFLSYQLLFTNFLLSKKVTKQNLGK
jgi:hypothetical protein